MNRTDELLEKYFAGITTLQEEKELKAYFGGNSILPKHNVYTPIFRAFETEKNIKAPGFEQKTETKQVPTRRKINYLLTSVAAACFFMMLIIRYQNTTNSSYMIVHGKRINNVEMAKQYANAKVEKSLNVIHKSLESYKDNKEIQEKLQEIENQLKVK